MALGKAVKGARHTPQTITWVGFDLSGGTITGRMIKKGSGSSVVDDARDIDGTLIFVDDGSDGKFDWTYGANDVGTEGEFYVQFKSTYGDSTFDMTDGLAEFKVLGVI